MSIRELNRLQVVQLSLSIVNEAQEGLMLEITKRKGIPASIYADKHSIFVTTRKSWTLEEELQGQKQPTQVGRALQPDGGYPYNRTKTTFCG